MPFDKNFVTDKGITVKNQIRYENFGTYYALYYIYIELLSFIHAFYRYELYYLII